MRPPACVVMLNCFVANAVLMHRAVLILMVTTATSSNLLWVRDAPFPGAMGFLTCQLCVWHTHVLLVLFLV